MQALRALDNNGSKFNRQGTAGFSPCVHLAGQTMWGLPYFGPAKSNPDRWWDSSCPMQSGRSTNHLRNRVAPTTWLFLLHMRAGLSPVCNVGTFMLVHVDTDVGWCRPVGSACCLGNLQPLCSFKFGKMHKQSSGRLYLPLVVPGHIPPKTADP